MLASATTTSTMRRRLTANVEGEDLDDEGGLQVDDVLGEEARARCRVIVVQRLHKLRRLQQQEGEGACHPLRSSTGFNSRKEMELAIPSIMAPRANRIE
ncbi:hypothetical protein Zm00014a_019943 [Zea mays]|uniref:Uncharacterized protein n=1 Tax=Zea mays TaxID=4577 RepID=A0A3L6FS86_MAIZE|nr:hypothetical protein Zm00014a_019943 [Zea mays]